MPATPREMNLPDGFVADVLDPAPLPRRKPATWSDVNVLDTPASMRRELHADRELARMGSLAPMVRSLRELA